MSRSAQVVSTCSEKSDQPRADMRYPRGSPVLALVLEPRPSSVSPRGWQLLASQGRPWAEAGGEPVGGQASPGARVAVATGCCLEGGFLKYLS